MAWTFTTAEGRQTGPDAAVSVTYGWGPLGTFKRMLAEEEGLDLRRMKDHGGTAPWTDDLTPLRLLFELDYVNGDHDISVYPAAIARLREIQTRWATRYPDDDGPEWTKDIQLRSLEQLINVMEACLSRGVRLRIR